MPCAAWLKWVLHHCPDWNGLFITITIFNSFQLSLKLSRNNFFPVLGRKSFSLSLFADSARCISQVHWPAWLLKHIHSLALTQGLNLHCQFGYICFPHDCGRVLHVSVNTVEAFSADNFFFSRKSNHELLDMGHWRVFNYCRSHDYCGRQHASVS